jgi:hypothetical protein
MNCDVCKKKLINGYHPTNDGKKLCSECIRKISTESILNGLSKLNKQIIWKTEK